MTELSFVVSPQLQCPYCGSLVRVDTDWVVQARQRWGWCGVQASLDGQVAGVLLLTPANGHDALLKTLWTRPAQQGLGKRLVQSACAGLQFRDVHAILSPGTSTNFSCQLPPKAFLRRVGFVRPSDETLYRLDLHSLVTEKSPAQQVVERLFSFGQPNPEAATSLADPSSL